MSLYLGRCYTPDPEAELQTREEALAAWKEPPPWGGQWRDFFENFKRCVSLDQPGVTVTDLWGWTSGDTPSTVPEIREAARNALDAGLIVRIVDEQPDGTREYYGLNPESWVLSQIMDAPTETALPQSQEETVQAVRKFSQLSFNNLAVECGFESANCLCAQSVLDFFAQGPYSLTEMYKSPALYPDHVDSFHFGVRSFIDAIIDQAVNSGVLAVKTEEQGREMYSLAPGIADMLQSPLIA